MPNLLSRMFRRSPDEITRFGIQDYIRWITDNRHGFGPTYGPPTTYAQGRPAEKVENSFSGYTYAGYKASPVVFGVMTKRASVFSEARFVWRRMENGRPGDLFADDALRPLARPWPNGTTGELLTRMIQDVDLAGNCYLINEGDRLRRLRPDWVQIVLSGDPRVDIDVDVLGYSYTPGSEGGGDGRVYLPDEVMHWSPIPDPDAMYRGMSWLTPVIREIQGDSAAVDHKLAFFANGATLGPIIKVPAGLTPAQFKEFIEASNAAHQGVSNAYRPMYVGGGADVTLGQATMQQMDFKALQSASETRICVAGQVPAVIVGVSEGLQGSSLNSGNYNAAKRSFVDGTLRPLWRSACAALSTIVDVPADAELWWDERDIAYLREDQQDLAHIQQTQASTINTLITAGYKPETVAPAVISDDFSTLSHSGLTSVQLQPPGTAPGDQAAGQDAAADEHSTLLQKQPRLAGTPTASTVKRALRNTPARKATPAVPAKATRATKARPPLDTDAILADAPTEERADSVGRAAGHDTTPGHDELHHYWTRGEGLARWRTSPHPFSTLRDLLAEHVPIEQANRMAAAWVHEVTGNWPGSDAHRVATGHPPRGHRIGPG